MGHKFPRTLAPQDIGTLGHQFHRTLVPYTEIHKYIKYWIYAANNWKMLFSWGVSVCPSSTGLGDVKICLGELMSQGTTVLGNYCPRELMSQGTNVLRELMSREIMSQGTNVLGTNVLGNQCPRELLSQETNVLRELMSQEIMSQGN